MFLVQFLTNLALFLVGVVGVFFNRVNVLIILMCLELIFLSSNLNFIMFSIYLDDFCGQLFSLFILTVVAAESSIGLAILITYYRLRGNLNISETIILQK